MGQDPQDTRNLFLALGLSVALLLVWQYFFTSPELKQTVGTNIGTQDSGRSALSPTEQGATAPPHPESGPLVPEVPGATQTPETGSAVEVRRIPIDTRNLSGSLNLTGARLDSLSLVKFHETVNPESPNIVLLAPESSEAPYFVHTGWVAAPGSSIQVPDTKSQWTLAADSENYTALRPGSPMHVQWANDTGQTFHIVFGVDDTFMFDIRQWVHNEADEVITVHPFAQIVRQAPPGSTWDYDASGFYILHEGLIGVLGEQGLQEIEYTDLLEDGSTRYANVNGWLGMTSKYWATAIIPPQDSPFSSRFSGSRSPWPKFVADALGSAVSVEPGQTGSWNFHVFAGAKQVSLLEKYQDVYGIDRFELLIDWGWFYFLTFYLFKLLNFIYSLVGNFGVSILIITILVKLVFFPLANKSYASISKMKKLQPKIKVLQERHSDDRMRLQKEMMELYKREDVNALAGCWPVLLQIPVFFALYKVLFVTIEMRHAPFFGWISDLAAPDPTSVFNLFGLLPFDVPPYMAIGIWPILMGITMFLQMRMNPTPADPIQAKIFSWMPVVFTLMLGTFPAGLVIYWAWNNSLSIAQQYVIMRRYGVKVELLDNLRDLISRK